MKINYHSTIVRYDGAYPSLSAFLMTPAVQPTDKESVQLAAQACWEKTENGFRASYREEDGTAAALSYTRDKLVFRRGGTEAVFAPSASTSFLHQTGYGAIRVEAYTSRLALQEKGGSFLLTLIYYSHIGDMVQQNTMKWKISP